MSVSNSITFAGAAGTVTGSKHLLRAGDSAVLLDCGLFQGIKQLRDRNWGAPPFEPGEVTSVVLSHAHLDHTGYLPILVERGFSGPIYCTAGTADLLKLVLLDAARLQEEDAARAARLGYSKHHPPRPLFTVEQAERALAQVETRPYETSFAVAPRLYATLRRAGHILGSATVEVRIDSMPPRRVVFSGDLGRRSHPILRSPTLVAHADVLLVESTYGDRIHEENTLDLLAKTITETALRGGTTIVPAFAIGRTQELIWNLRRLEDEGRIPHVPVFIDSPMAIDATEIFCKHPEDHSLDMADLMDRRRCPLCCREYHLLRTSDESKSLNDRRGPMLIIAGSGMISGGRVLHHLARCLPDRHNTVLLVGYQAVGTRGRALQDGARTVRIHGRDVSVRAEIVTIPGLSAHADRNEILWWLSGFEQPPAQTYVVHGEAKAAASLATTIRSELGWSVAVARDDEMVALPQ